MGSPSILGHKYFRDSDWSGNNPQLSSEPIGESCTLLGDMLLFALNWVLLIVVSPLFATRIKYVRDVLSIGKKEEVLLFCTIVLDYSLNCTPLSPTYYHY